jgi:hypothetical protein
MWFLGGTVSDRKEEMRARVPAQSAVSHFCPGIVSFPTRRCGPDDAPCGFAVPWHLSGKNAIDRKRLMPEGLDREPWIAETPP